MLHMPWVEFHIVGLVFPIDGSSVVQRRLYGTRTRRSADLSRPLFVFLFHPICCRPTAGAT